MKIFKKAKKKEEKQEKKAQKVSKQVPKKASTFSVNARQGKCFGRFS